MIVMESDNVLLFCLRQMTYSRPGSYSSTDILKGLQALRMYVVDLWSGHTPGWQQGFFQLACVGIGVLAVSTLLVGGFLWDYSKLFRSS